MTGTINSIASLYGATDDAFKTENESIKVHDESLKTEKITMQLSEEKVKAAEGQALTKVIIETSLLTEEEKVQACQLAKQAGADFVKTST